MADNHLTIPIIIFSLDGLIQQYNKQERQLGWLKNQHTILCYQLKNSISAKDTDKVKVKECQINYKIRKEIGEQHNRPTSSIDEQKYT